MWFFLAMLDSQTGEVTGEEVAVNLERASHVHWNASGTSLLFPGDGSQEAYALGVADTKRLRKVLEEVRAMAHGQHV